MICSNCGEEFVGNFCPRCGKAVFADQDKTKCPNCGIEFNGNFCPNCGHPKSTDISHINSLPPTNEQPEYENLQNTQPPIFNYNKQFEQWCSFSLYRPLPF